MFGIREANHCSPVRYTSLISPYKIWDSEPVKITSTKSIHAGLRKAPVATTDALGTCLGSDIKNQQIALELNLQLASIIITSYMEGSTQHNASFSVASCHRQSSRCAGKSNSKKPQWPGRKEEGSQRWWYDQIYEYMLSGFSTINGNQKRTLSLFEAVPFAFANRPL